MSMQVGILIIIGRVNRRKGVSTEMAKDIFMVIKMATATGENVGKDGKP